MTWVSIETASTWLQPSTRMKLFPVDVVAFAARCPGCGWDARWLEWREASRCLVKVQCQHCERGRAA